MEAIRPLMLGLVGESAAGKTTLVRGVVRLLGRDGVTPLCLDDYHRYSRAELLARGLTAADPAANDLGLMAVHLAELRAGRRISKPLYDHRTGTLRGPEVVAPTGLVVAYGMLTLTPPSTPELFDLTVYLDPEPALRRAWRLARDVGERGYRPDEVAALAPARDRDAARFVLVQRARAAMIVRFRPHAGDSPELDAEITLRDCDDQLWDELAAASLPGLMSTRLDADEDGRACGRVQIGATIAPDVATAVAELIRRRLPAVPRQPLDSLGQVREGGAVRHAPALALTQLLIVARLVRTRNM